MIIEDDGLLCFSNLQGTKSYDFSHLRNVDVLCLSGYLIRVCDGNIQLITREQNSVQNLQDLRLTDNKSGKICLSYLPVM